MSAKSAAEEHKPRIVSTTSWRMGLEVYMFFGTGLDM